MGGSTPAKLHALRIVDATRQLFDDCRRLEQVETIGENPP